MMTIAKKQPNLLHRYLPILEWLPRYLVSLSHG
jgi:hypothetical protein